LEYGKGLRIIEKEMLANNRDNLFKVMIELNSTLNLDENIVFSNPRDASCKATSLAVLFQPNQPDNRVSACSVRRSWIKAAIWYNDLVSKDPVRYNDLSQKVSVWYDDLPLNPATLPAPTKIKF
jgi:hypothetical protein